MTINLRAILVMTVIAVAAITLATSAFAKEQGGTRPGWGYGDKNHVHTGPPGQSVRPQQLLVTSYAIVDSTLLESTIVCGTDSINI